MTAFVVFVLLAHHMFYGCAGVALLLSKLIDVAADADAQAKRRFGK